MPLPAACSGDRTMPILHKLKWRRHLKSSHTELYTLSMRPAATMKPVSLITVIACARLA